MDNTQEVARSWEGHTHREDREGGLGQVLERADAIKNSMAGCSPAENLTETEEGVRGAWRKALEGA